MTSFVNSLFHINLFVLILLSLLILKEDFNRLVEYSLRESVSAQGREGRGFDSNPGRNLKKKGYILSRDWEVTLTHWSRSIELVITPLIDL
jgi:hypothetical protein